MQVLRFSTLGTMEVIFRRSERSQNGFKDFGLSALDTLFADWLRRLINLKKGVSCMVLKIQRQLTHLNSPSL